MTRFAEFHFALPIALWALAVIPALLAIFFAGEAKRRAALDSFLSRRLQPRLAGTASPTRRRLSFLLMTAALALATLALAQPRWGFSWEERTDKGRDVIIAIDTSRSMLAQDLKPNRMTRAKLAAQDLLAALQGDRAGLVAFAGSAFLQAPLTADYDAVRNSLSEIDSEIIPRGGTNLTAAIETADDAFGKGESQHRALIIFTDGEELEKDAVEAARAAAKKFRIFTIGLGSPEGGLIPVTTNRGGTDFVRDDAGKYVTSKLDEARLREIAEASGGFYVRLQGGPAEMQQIVRDGLGKMKERESDSRFTKQPIERYHWPLTGAVAFAVAGLLLGDRRRFSTRKVTPLLVAGILFAGGSGAMAVQPQADFNRGCEAYKSGNYTAAAEAFSVALGTGPADLQPKAAYNLANTLARRGAALEKKEDKITEWKNALQHYDRVISLEPGNADAKHNRDIVQKALDDLQKEEKKQEQEPEKKPDPDKKDDENKDKNDQKDEKQGSKSNEEEKNNPSKGGDQQDNKEKEQKDKSQGTDKKDEKSDQSGKKQEQEQKDGQQKQDNGKQGESKEGDGKEGKEKDGETKNGAPKPGEKKDQPQPKPGEGQEPPKQGELKANNPPPGGAGGGQGNEPKNSEAAEEAAAAAEGRMTEKQANTLLNAIKDEKVRLLDPRQIEQQRPSRGFKNW